MVKLAVRACSKEKTMRNGTMRRRVLGKPLGLPFLLLLLSSASSDGVSSRATLVDRAPDALALNSVRRALTCLESRGSSRPLVAMSPERLFQFHHYLRRVRRDPSCKRGRHTRFCGVGTCTRDAGSGGCRCLFGFAGQRCDVYPGRCWLMYCFLQDCYSVRGARLRCVCDRSLYGTGVLSNLYWYNDALQVTFRPPPPSWVDVVPKQEDDLESYIIDGVDDEIDLTLYQEALAAAVAPAKAAIVAWLPSTHGVALNAPELARVAGASDHWSSASPSSAGSPAASSERGAWARLGSDLFSRAILALPKYEVPKIGRSSEQSARTVLMPNASRKSSAAAPEIISKGVKSTLERDFGGDAKFVYEDYASVDDAAQRNRLQLSPATALEAAWQFYALTAFLVISTQVA